MKKYEVMNLKDIVFSHGKTNSCGVANNCVGKNTLKISNKKRDNFRCILVIEVKIDDSVFVVLINIYNANTESEQLHTLNDLINILEIFKDIQSKSAVLGGDFNVTLNPSLDSEDGKPVIKKKTIAKLIQITENLDIWRIHKPKRKRFTYRQHHSTGFIQRRLDYFSYLILFKNLLKSQIRCYTLAFLQIIPRQRFLYVI